MPLPHIINVMYDFNKPWGGGGPPVTHVHKYGSAEGEAMNNGSKI